MLLARLPIVCCLLWLAASLLGGCCCRPISTDNCPPCLPIQCAANCQGGCAAGNCEDGCPPQFLPRGGLHLFGCGLGVLLDRNKVPSNQHADYLSPLPKFHPVPTRPAFEPQPIYPPLESLDWQRSSPARHHPLEAMRPGPADAASWQLPSVSSH